MPDRIRLLPEIVASQIAAGQVVTGPHSVVKEMIENSLDAGARSVTVNIREGGHDLIQIVDDGCGMSPLDARMAFDHHATSKIATADDIYALHTFGFRGEALASIAAVAQVELRTRQADDETGTVTTIHGGHFVAQEPAACRTGTQFLVRSLFYNIPVRRKSLPSVRESQNKVRTEFNRVALCYPDVRFELYENDAPVMILEPSSLAGRIVDVMGKSIKQNLLEVSVDTSIVKIGGFIGRPDAAMSGSYRRKESMHYMFVNGRYFRSQYLYSAILKAYDKLIPEGSSPSYFLYFTVDPQRVDVNMDAQKIDVRFADESAVWSILSAAVRETLAKTGAVPMMEFNPDDAAVEIPVARRGAVYMEPRSNYDDSYNPFRVEAADELADSGSAQARPQPNHRAASAPRTSHRFEASAGMEMLPSAAFEAFESEAFGAWGGAGAESAAEGSDPAADSPAGQAASSLEFVESENYRQMELAEDVAQDALQPRFKRVTVIGARYAAAFYGGRFVTVDLKRACERVLYDEYMAVLRNGVSATQRLLFPERLTLTNGDYALLAEHAPEFSTLGFDIEYSGGTTVDVLGTPADMPDERIDELIYELLRAMDTPHSAQEIRRQRIAEVMARNGARAAAGEMDDQMAAALLDRLAVTENVSFTPGGKKILAVLTTAEVKKKLE